MVASKLLRWTDGMVLCCIGGVAHLAFQPDLMQCCVQGFLKRVLLLQP
jgi:hypothetical protein